MQTADQTPLSERQSIDLIQKMIRQAQARFTDDGTHLIWWGSLVLVAALSHYALLHTAWARPASWIWLLMPVGGVGAYFIGRRRRQERGARTLIDRMLGSIWSCVGGAIGLIFVLVGITHTWQVAYPMILLLYGMALVFSGSVLRFRPLLAGGFVCWALSVGAAFVGFETQLLYLAAAVVAGFIVPGVLSRMRYQQDKNRFAHVVTAV